MNNLPVSRTSYARISSAAERRDNLDMGLTTKSKDSDHGIDGSKKGKGKGKGGEDHGKPSSFLVNSSLISAQVIFGISAVVGTIGLPSFHPLTFALIRESCATVILLLAGHYYSISKGREEGILSGSLKDWSMFAISGLGIFGSQAFYIIGIKLSSAVAASVWQPSQPIITAAVCMILGWEPFSLSRCVGILVAFLGCAIMVMGGGGGAGEAIGGEGSGDNGAFSQLMGQFSFLLNCFGSSLYVLASKTIIGTGRYESVAITAWSYLVASFYMLIFSVLMSLSDTLSSFLCSDCVGNIWHVPKSAIPAMVFFVLFTSSGAYGLITWANKYATGTLVIGYTVMQPVASAVLIQMLVMGKLYKGCTEEVESDEICLEQPDIFTAFGAIGVFTGLMVIIYTEPEKDDDTEISDMDYADFEEEATSLLELAERNGFTVDDESK